MSLSASLLLPLFALAAPGDVVATYEGGTVARAEYQDWLLANGLTDDAAQRRDYLEAVALAESLEAAAVAAGVDRRPQTAFRLVQIETGLLAAALRQEVDRSIVITEAEVEAALLAEDKERFKPRTVQLRNIFKRAPPGATPSERAALRVRMEELRQELQAGASFDDLAWRESDSQTRFRGGALGYVPPGVLHPDVERLAFALKKGELSAVLESADGFTLLRCDDIAEARVMPLDEARTMIRQGLWARASTARQAALRSELLREAAPRFEGEGGRDDSPAATFRGGQITEAQLRWLAAASAAGALSGESRRRLLEEEVLLVMAAERARRQGLHQDPILRARSRWQRATLLATEEIVRRVNRILVAPTDAELRDHYERNRERYVRLAEVDVSVILWRLEASTMKRQFAEAETLLGRLQTRELEFDAAARETSHHASASQGGRLGFLLPPQLAGLGPNVFRVVQELSPGQTNGLVQDDNLLWIVKLWDRRPERPLTYEEAAPRVETELGDGRVAALRTEREAEARQALKLQVARAGGMPAR
jgi:parvulin-like peptidyl-prolyl isomerase